MWKIEFENKILEEILSDWEAFLFSGDIYWPIRIKAKNIPPLYRNVRLSPGRLLIAEKLTSVNNIEDELLRRSVHSNQEKFKQLKIKWKANWEKKTLTEIPIRIRQWQRLTQEIHQDRDYSTHQLANDIQIRLMITLLLEQIEVDNLVDHLQLLELSDMKFKSITIEDSFIWEDHLATIFKINQYWYLYRNIMNPGG